MHVPSEGQPREEGVVSAENLLSCLRTREILDEPELPEATTAESFLLRSVTLAVRFRKVVGWAVETFEETLVTRGGIVSIVKVTDSVLFMLPKESFIMNLAV